MIPEINEKFGLTPEQIDRLAPDRRVAVFKAISAGGSVLIGRLVTRDLLLAMLKVVGIRLTAGQAAKVVPIAGQAVSAALTFSALKYVCEQHIKQCIAVSRQLALPHATPTTMKCETRGKRWERAAHGEGVATRRTPSPIHRIEERFKAPSRHAAPRRRGVSTPRRRNGQQEGVRNG